jgi:hypothetical protein
MGFVVTSDKNQSLKPMFVYKKDNTFMFYTSDWQKDVEGIANKGKQYSVGDTVTMTLVYKGGMYYIFMDGELACSVSATAKATYGDTKVCETIGFEKMLYLGLASLNGEPTTYTDWWYDTNTEVVDGYYVPGETPEIPDNPDDPEPPVVEPDENPVSEVSNFACNIEPEEEGQFNNNAEASNINPHFEVEATFNGGDENGLIGFAFTAEDGKVMRFAYDKVKGRFGFMAGESGWDHYREYALETDVYNAEGANTIKVVYNGNRIFEVYMNGTKMVATDGRQGQFYLGWNCRGTAADSSLTDMKPYQMWGSSTIDSRATLTISA